MKYTLLLVSLACGMVTFSCHRSLETSGKSASKTNAKALSHSKPIQIDTSKWKGEWERTDWQAGGSITMRFFKGNTFDFEIQVVNGGHTGEIEGSGRLQGDSAIFTSDEEKGCRLVFRLAGDLKKITLNATNECSVYGGVGVYFDGDYEKNAKPKKETLITLNVLNTEQDHRLTSLVDTFYQRYVDCTDIIDTDGQKDIDNLDATVINAGVRGLFTQMEYIIMMDKQSHIWTAVIDNETVHYFTNSDLSKDHLPKTIDAWRENFKDYPVIYHNK